MTAPPPPATFSDRARGVFAGLTAWAGGRMVALGVHPDTITWFGTGVVLVAAVAIGTGSLFLGGLLLLFSLPLDALDGATARAMKRTDRRGAVLDSTLDRYADGFITGGLVFYYATRADLLMLVVALAGGVGTFAVSYIRARAGEAGLSVKVGFFSRFERVIVLLLMLLIPPLLPVGVWVLAIGTHLTALQRLLYVNRHLDR
jgi:CDP-diacylglycerol--glycerol-3-phosphate 3-phosphatidyltransferase